MGGTVAYIPRAEEAARVVGWSRIFLRDDEPDLSFVCAGGFASCDSAREILGDEAAPITPLEGPLPWQRLAEHLRSTKAQTLISGSGGDWHGDVDRIREIMRSAPCETFLDLGGASGPDDTKRVLVVATGSAHDTIAVRAAHLLAVRNGGVATIAKIEADVGAGAYKVGEQALAGILHEADVQEGEHLDTKVVVDNHPVRGVLTCFDDHDLVIVGMNDLPLIRTLGKALDGATLAVVKRTPPLKVGGRAHWLPQINPTDYAVLVQQLRQGSQWNADFVMMLGLAAAVASLGLMQNSPAVVIGSMLLAPLMTPMIGVGMALLQANGKLGRSAGKAIALGALLTLTVSFALGFLDPGDTLAPEVLARGGPNLLDLGIALFAAIAAGYAMARPTIGGAVAGVAIATALVPPLCACGISLACGLTGALGARGEYGIDTYDGAFMNALGAALLFVTNLFAIMLASTFIFSRMGVTVPRTFSRARRTARLIVIGLVAVLLLLCIPLGLFLAKQMDEGRAEPLGHPVTRTVAETVLGYVEHDADVRVMFMGRSPVSPMILIHLATKRTLRAEFLEGLRAEVREASGDPNVQVIIVGVRWMDEGGKDDG